MFDEWVSGRHWHTLADSAAHTYIIRVALRYPSPDQCLQCLPMTSTALLCLRSPSIVIIALAPTHRLIAYSLIKLYVI